MQRLFSTFANGWPGAGILVQRTLAGSILLYCGIVQISAAEHGLYSVPAMLSAAAGLLLLAGLWTPIAGTTAFLAQLWTYRLGFPQPTAEWVSAIFAMTLAMIGPGAWSLDARLFGRRHIESDLTPQNRISPNQ